MHTLPDNDTARWCATQPLFRVLPAGALKGLGHELRERRYAKGETIYSELERPRSLWIVREGRVRLLRYSSSGRAFALRVVTGGDLFCIPSIMNPCPYPCRAVADTETTLVVLAAIVFHQLIERFPALACEALKLVCQHCCQAHAMCSATQERVEQRILACLVQLQESFGTTFPFSRQELAELVGTSRETANRVLLKLEQTGTIALAFRRLTIHDPARLRSWLERPS